MKRLIPILFLLVSGVANAEKWLCIEEQSTGFRFKDSEWVVSNFKLRKFLIIKEKSGYWVEEFGTKKPIFRPDHYWLTDDGDDCKYVTDDSEGMYLLCENIIHKMIFHPKTRRFVYWYFWGYWDGVENNDNTPKMQIGECSSL